MPQAGDQPPADERAPLLADPSYIRVDVPMVASDSGGDGDSDSSVLAGLGEEDGDAGTRTANGDGPAESAVFLVDTDPRRFWLCFGLILSTTFIVCFDSTIMASSHPVITSHFGSSNSASWLSTAFLLTNTTFQPLAGRISDALGRKPPYVAAMAIFCLATLACALAPSMASFIAARAVCGLGAGGAMTLGAIIISDIVPIERRGSYQALINIIYGISTALGAALGGVMADNLGWRWEFGVQVPVLVICVVVAALAIPGNLGLHDKAREPLWVAMKSFDFKGSGLLTVSITFFILGLNLGGNVLPWSHPFVITSLVIFGVCFPLFLYVETVAEKPIMPLQYIRKPPHMNLIFANHIAAILVNAILFNIPLFFQGVLLTSATASGLRLVVPAAVASVAGTATGFLISYTRRLKWPLATGTLCFLLGTASLASMRRGWPDSLYLLCLVPAAAGQGFQSPGTFMAILACSEARMQAVVTSALVLWRSLGMVLGVAASSLVMQNALRAYLADYVAGPDKDDIVTRARTSVAAVRDLPAPYRDQVVRSYEAALRATFLGCASLALISVVLILPLKLPRLKRAR